MNDKLQTALAALLNALTELVKEAQTKIKESK